MDAVITKLPALADTAGQTADLQRIVAVDGAIAGRIALAGAQGTMASTAGAMKGGFDTSFTHTADPSLRSLGAPLATTLGTTGALGRSVDPTGRGAVDPTVARRGDQALQAVAALEAATTPKLDTLLAARTARLSGARTKIGALVVAALLAAIWLFVGFFLAVRGAVAEIAGRLRSLTERDTTDLRAGLEAVAARDLTLEIEPSTPAIERIDRDELGEVARAVNAIRDNTVASVDAYNATRLALAAAIGQVAGTAERVSRASGEMAVTSHEAGRAVGEIAARRRRRRPRRRAPGPDASAPPARAPTRSRPPRSRAPPTCRRPSTPRSARAVAREGVAAVAARSTEAMRAVRDSSTEASDAIRGLSAPLRGTSPAS